MVRALSDSRSKGRDKSNSKSRLTNIGHRDSLKGLHQQNEKFQNK